MKTQAAGQRGEEAARVYLEQKGYRFLTANWRCKAGEIDLVMEAPPVKSPGGDHGAGTLVFVEVRSRRPTSFGAGYETVAWQKQRKLVRAGKWYMQQEKWRGDVRFDVVSIVDDGSSQPVIEHIEYAFDSSY
ncbi:MAG: YraN family protein [Patescibacteria group bacterium]